MAGRRRWTEAREPIERESRTHAGDRRNAHRGQARQSRRIWTAKAEHQRRRGERQAVAAGDAARCPGRTGEITRHTERRCERPAGDVADGEERYEHAAATPATTAAVVAAARSSATASNVNGAASVVPAQAAAPAPGPTAADGVAMVAMAMVAAATARPPTTSRKPGKACHPRAR